MNCDILKKVFFREEEAIKDIVCEEDLYKPLIHIFFYIRTQNVIRREIKINLFCAQFMEE